MKQITSNVLLDQLQSDVREIILQANRLKQIDASYLQQLPAAGKWSVAQLFEHLNIYCRYYIQTIEKKLHLHQSNPAAIFFPGWLGNYFTNLMKPSAENRVVRKMKAPSFAQPSAQPDAKQMLEEFLSHQHHLVNLLQIARSANLNTIRIPISINKMIRLKLGDTFAFFIAHEQRHFVQVNEILSTIKKNQPHNFGF